jgi:hypothetical protein
VGVHNLHQKTRLFLEHKFSWLTKRFRHLEPHYDSRKERLVVRAYSLFFVVGLLVTIFVVAAYQVPIIVTVFYEAARNLVGGIIYSHYVLFGDAIAFLLLFTINQSLLISSLIKQHRFYRRVAFFWAALLFFIFSNYFIVFFGLILLLVFVSYFLLFYFFVALLGFVFGELFVVTIRRINEMHGRQQVIAELFIPGMSLICSFAMVYMSEMFISLTGAGVDKSPALIGLLYAYGILTALLVKFLKDIVKQKSLHKKPTNL